MWRGRLRDPGGGLTPLLSLVRLWDELSLGQGERFWEESNLPFLGSRRKNPGVPLSLHRLSRLPHPAPGVSQPLPCQQLSLPAGTVLLKALCDDGETGASILVLLGGGELCCNGDSASVWELTPAWCRVCCSLWLSLQSCKRPHALGLQDPAGIFAPFSPRSLPSSCPSPHPLFYPALPPTPCSESPCLHRGGTRRGKAVPV